MTFIGICYGLTDSPFERKALHLYCIRGDCDQYKDGLIYIFIQEGQCSFSLFMFNMRLLGCGPMGRDIFLCLGFDYEKTCDKTCEHVLLREESNT